MTALRHTPDPVVTAQIAALKSGAQQMTVAEFLALVAKGDRKADEMVLCELYPLGIVREHAIHHGDVPPYATAGPDHPDQGNLWWEMFRAYAVKSRLSFRAAMAELAQLWWDMWKPGCLPSPNAAAAVALLLAAGVLVKGD